MEPLKQPFCYFSDRLLESLESKILTVLREKPLGKGPLAKVLGQKQASGPLHKAIREMLEKGLIERTLPDKPNSRLQKYRLTAAGAKAVKVGGNDAERKLLQRLKE